MKARNNSNAPTSRRAPKLTAEAARYAIVGTEAPVVANGPAPAWHNPRRVISATEAARRFSELISRVCYKGESYVVEKGGRPMCELSPIESSRFSGADFLAILSTLPKPDEEFLAGVEDAVRSQPTIEPSPWER